MAAGFGVGLGDIIAISQLAISVYNQCRQSPSQYRHLADETLQLSKILQDLERIASVRCLDLATSKELLQRGKACRDVLQDLQARVQEYKLLGQEKKFSQRLKWDQQYARDIRNRLTSNVVMLSTFYTSTLMTSLVSMNQSLQIVAKETEKTRNECVAIRSVIASHSATIESSNSTLNERPASHSSIMGKKPKPQDIERIKSKNSKTSPAALLAHLQYLSSAPLLNDTSIIDDALLYLDTIKLMANTNYKIYNTFLDLMKLFKSCRCDTIDVALGVGLLFENYLLLIKAFQAFCPDSIFVRITVERDITYYRLFEVERRSAKPLFEICRPKDSDLQVWYSQVSGATRFSFLQDIGFEASNVSITYEDHNGGSYYNIKPLTDISGVRDRLQTSDTNPGDSCSIIESENEESENEESENEESEDEKPEHQDELFIQPRAEDTYLKQLSSYDYRSCTDPALTTVRLNRDSPTKVPSTSLSEHTAKQAYGLNQSLLLPSRDRPSNIFIDLSDQSKTLAPKLRRTKWRPNNVNADLRSAYISGHGGKRYLTESLAAT